MLHNRRSLMALFAAALAAPGVVKAEPDCGLAQILTIPTTGFLATK